MDAINDLIPARENRKREDAKCFTLTVRRALVIKISVAVNTGSDVL